MANTVDRFKTDLDKLIKDGARLELSMLLECHPEEITKQLREHHKAKTDSFIDSLPSFNRDYERWYSQAKALLSQLLPGRLDDFVQHYEPAKTRKELNVTTYRIRDYFQGARMVRMGHVLVDRTSAIVHFKQQLAIVAAAQDRFESSLFEIRQILQADLLDSELEAAEHLSKYKFVRAAGAVAGVVLERHLSQVCKDREIKTGVKNPTISNFNEALKASDVIDVPQWRFIQHLADIRNLCDHSKVPEPTAEQVQDLISGVKRIMKTVY
jgi:hypothetical protein